MSPPHYDYDSHDQVEEEREVDNSPSYLLPSRSEPYFAQAFDAASQSATAYSQNGSSLVFMPQSNQGLSRERSNQFLAPPPPFVPKQPYDDGPYYNPLAFAFQSALQLPNTPQVIVSGPPSHYEGNDMSPSIATGNITGTIGSETPTHYRSGYYSNNSPSPRTHDYGPNLHASDANFSNTGQVLQQYAHVAPNLSHNQAQQMHSLPVASNSSKLFGFECTCDAGFHKTESQRKKCIARQEKPAKCSYPNCDYATATQSDLQRHINCKHSNDRNKKHACPLCTRPLFSRIDNYKTHLEKVHRLSEMEILEYVKQSKERVAAYCDSLPRHIQQPYSDDYSNQGQVEHDLDAGQQETSGYNAWGNFDCTNATSDAYTSNTAGWFGEYNMDTVERPAQSLDGDADLMDVDTPLLQNLEGALTPHPVFPDAYPTPYDAALQFEANMPQTQPLSPSRDTDFNNYQDTLRRPTLAGFISNTESAPAEHGSSQYSVAGSRPSFGYTQPTSTHSSSHFNATLSRTTSKEEEPQCPVNTRALSSNSVPQMSGPRPALRQITTGPAANHHNQVAHRTSRVLSEAFEVIAAHGYEVRLRNQAAEPSNAQSASGKRDMRHPESSDPDCETCQRLKREGKNSELRKHITRMNRRYFCTHKRCDARCGSKDELKRHANSQHYHVEKWRCGLPTKQHPHQLCKYQSHHAHSLTTHITDKHSEAVGEGQNAKDVMKECEMKSESFPREMWCGHCRIWRRLIGNEKEIWDGWWNHVEDHLLGRKGEAQRRAEDWERNADAKPQHLLMLDCQSQDQSQPQVQRQSSIPQPGMQMNLAVRGGPVAEVPAVAALRHPKRRATSSPERKPSNKRTSSSGRSQTRTDVVVVCCQCNWVMSAGICPNPSSCQHKRCMGCYADELRADDDD